MFVSVCTQSDNIKYLKAWKDIMKIVPIEDI